MTDTFHEAAIAHDDERVVVVEFLTESRAQVALGHRHADRICKALSKRTSGDLHSGRVAVFRMPGRGGSPLAECADVVDLQSVAVEIQHGVLENRRMSIGEDEAIPPAPGRMRRIMSHDAAVEHVGEWSKCHGGALMTALGEQWRIHCETANHRDREVVLLLGQPFRHGSDDSRRAR